MFNNPGTKIKNLAKTLFTIMAVLSVLTPVIMYMAEILDEDLFILIPIIALIGIGSAYISCLFLAAFGELVETNTAIKESNEKILAKMNQN